MLSGCRALFILTDQMLICVELSPPSGKNGKSMERLVEYFLLAVVLWQGAVEYLAATGLMKSVRNEN